MAHTEHHRDHFVDNLHVGSFTIALRDARCAGWRSLGRWAGEKRRSDALQRRGVLERGELQLADFLTIGVNETFGADGDVADIGGEGNGPARSAHSIATACLQLSVTVQLKSAVARVERSVGAVDREERVAVDDEIERVARLLDGTLLKMGKTTRGAYIRNTGTRGKRLKVGLPERVVGGKEQTLAAIAWRGAVGQVLRDDFLIGGRRLESGGGTIHSTNHAGPLPWGKMRYPLKVAKSISRAEWTAGQGEHALSLACAADTVKRNNSTLREFPAKLGTSFPGALHFFPSAESVAPAGAASTLLFDDCVDNATNPTRKASGNK
jgi:hypothetical protein